MAGVGERRVRLVRARRDPVVAQTLRATTAAVLAYVLALQVSRQPSPLTAPLTALLVVQVTLYSTLTTGVRRVYAVVIGVLLAIGFSAVVGLSWWSLGLIILAALTVGHQIRVDESVNEVAISAMLVLGVTQLAAQAWDRVFETLIGAGVGLAFNLVFAPPVWVDPAAESIEDLARRISLLLRRMGRELGAPPVVERVEAQLYEARRLDHFVAEVDEALRQAEDSLRLNPRVSDGLLSRLVLRTGLDTLEICVVVVRVLTRSLTDLAKRRGRDEPLFAPDVAAGLEELFRHLGSAVQSFAELVSSQVSADAEQAEAELAAQLTAAGHSRETVAQQLLARVRQHPDAWQLHGAVLTEIDRILDELDLEHRSRRLMEELDRAALQRRARYTRLGPLGGFIHGERPDWWPRHRPAAFRAPRG
jgi:Aromatic acid exporter family member 1